MENRIMIKLSFLNSPYTRVAEIYRLLDTLGFEAMILPKVDCGKRAFLFISKNDLKKTRDAFDILGIQAEDEEVLIITLDNKIGAIADISREIRNKRVSIYRAFLADISLSQAYLILECSDNKLALRALENKQESRISAF